MKRKFKFGERVKYMDQLYQVGYVGKAEMVVIYRPGKIDIWDSLVVDINLLEKIVKNEK